MSTPVSAGCGPEDEESSRSPLTREALADGTILRHFQAAGDKVTLLPEAERLARFEAVIDSIAPGEDLWLFAYGSMLWNPTVRYVESRKVTVRGWHRSFCLRTMMGRGSPEQPGLMLAIEPGGLCEGLAYRLPSASIRDELHLLWQREMLTGSYQASWVRAFCTANSDLLLLAFTIDPAAPSYEGGLTDSEKARRIRHAKGFLGSNRDYLFKTRTHLREQGIHDDYVERLASAIETEPSAADPE